MSVVEQKNNTLIRLNPLGTKTYELKTHRKLYNQIFHIEININNEYLNPGKYYINFDKILLYKKGNLIGKKFILTNIDMFVDKNIFIPFNEFGESDIKINQQIFEIRENRIRPITIKLEIRNIDNSYLDAKDSTFIIFYGLWKEKIVNEIAPLKIHYTT